MARGLPRGDGSDPTQAKHEDEDQLPLFSGGATAAPVPKRVRRRVAMNPGTELRTLVGRIARASGLSFAEVNSEINRSLGLRSRAGADAEVLSKAVAVAETWLDRLLTQGESATVGTVVDVVAAAESAGPGGMAIADSSRRSQPGRGGGPRPTEEQSFAVDVFRSGHHMAVQAGAGTGKTTTLALLASQDRRRGQYVAFSRPIADEAAAKFPSYVSCRTGHSLAFAAVGRQYEARLNAPRQPGWKVGEALGIHTNMVVRIGERKVSNRALSYTVFRTVQRFCQSADTEIHRHHVPSLRGLESAEHHQQLVQLALPYAHRAWEDLQNPLQGAVRFEHDHYLKLWALTRPRIRADYVLLDEAQDTNPVFEEVFAAQREHAQLVMVGDSAQAIYGWRGARDVMVGFEGEQLSLSQSFRFGPALAEEANRWLTIVDAPLRLRGTPELRTQIGPVDQPGVILCRSNVGAVMEILRLLAEGRRVALVGGGTALLKLAQAAADLKAGRRVSHPELVLFESWADLQEYATYDPSGQDLFPLVDVIDEHGVEVILNAIARLSEERDAEVAVSTAHKAKGREWPTVRIAGDFEPAPGKELDEQGRPLPVPVDLEEARLAYVAVTRARHALDLGGLQWINDHPQGGWPQQPSLPDAAVQMAAPSWESPWDSLGPVPD